MSRPYRYSDPTSPRLIRRARSRALVADDEARVVVLLDRPGRREAAGIHFRGHLQHLRNPSQERVESVRIEHEIKDDAQRDEDQQGVSRVGNDL